MSARSRLIVGVGLFLAFFSWAAFESDRMQPRTVTGEVDTAVRIEVEPSYKTDVESWPACRTERDLTSLLEGYKAFARDTNDGAPLREGGELFTRGACIFLPTDTPVVLLGRRGDRANVLIDISGTSETLFVSAKALKQW